MFRKKTRVISNRFRKIDSLKKFSSYIGKIVYSKSGEHIGRIYDLLFSKDTFVGVLVKGKKDVFIGKEFFRGESDKSIILKIEPITNLIGKQVFDAIGKRVGIVKDIKRKTKSNNYTDLRIKKSIYRRSFYIPKKDIEVAKKNIILKKEYNPKK